MQYKDTCPLRVYISVNCKCNQVFTARISSKRGGYVFTGVSFSRGGWGVPLETGQKDTQKIPAVLQPTGMVPLPPGPVGRESLPFEEDRGTPPPLDRPGIPSLFPLFPRQDKGTQPSPSRRPDHATGGMLLAVKQDGFLVISVELIMYA